MENNTQTLVEMIIAQVVPLIASIIALLIAYGSKKIVSIMDAKMSFVKDENLRKNLENSILIAVNKTNEEFVKTAKTMSADGKLTEDEKQKAIQIARNHIDSLIKDSDMKNYLIQIGEEYVRAKINELANKLK